VVSWRTCLASSTNELGTSTSLGPADRKSGASKPGARWISDGMPASFSTPSISSATDSSGAAATFTHLSAMHVSYPGLFTEPKGRLLDMPVPWDRWQHGVDPIEDDGAPGAGDDLLVAGVEPARGGPAAGGQAAQGVVVGGFVLLRY
jgi:hypothetical protein